MLSRQLDRRHRRRWRRRMEVSRRPLCITQISLLRRSSCHFSSDRSMATVVQGVYLACSIISLICCIATIAAACIANRDRKRPLSRRSLSKRPSKKSSKRSRSSRRVIQQQQVAAELGPPKSRTRSRTRSHSSRSSPIPPTATLPDEQETSQAQSGKGGINIQVTKQLFPHRSNVKNAEFDCFRIRTP